MAHTIIKVAFEPAFTLEFKHWIKATVAVSMSSVDSEHKQYSLDTIVVELEEQEEKEDRPLFVEDASLMALLTFQEIEYVEF